MKEAFSRPLRRAGGAASALLMFAALLLAAAGVSANEPMTLDAVRERVIQDYPAVSQISTGEAAELMARDDGVLLFDVREADEYAVSRIPGAIRVDPGIWTFSFMSRFGDQLAGKTLIFYCSVGVRSAQLAQQVQQEALAAGAIAVYNLDGGIFAWHNEERELENDFGATEFVHPYDSYWGRLVERASLIRTRPE